MPIFRGLFLLLAPSDLGSGGEHAEVVRREHTGGDQKNPIEIRGRITTGNLPKAPRNAGV